VSRKHIITRPTKNQDIMSYEELYDDFSQDWQEKAKALQVRRWRAFKHGIKRG